MVIQLLEFEDIAKRLNSWRERIWDMPDKKPTEICPVCGGTDLYYEAGGYTGKVYHCKICGYIGALIVEADEEMARAIKEDYEHKTEA